MVDPYSALCGDYAYIRTAPKVSGGTERRTKIGRSGFLNRQHPLIELP